MHKDEMQRWGENTKLIFDLTRWALSWWRSPLLSPALISSFSPLFFLDLHFLVSFSVPYCLFVFCYSSSSVYFSFLLFHFPSYTVFIHLKLLFSLFFLIFISSYRIPFLFRIVYSFPATAHLLPIPFSSSSISS